METLNLLAKLLPRADTEQLRTLLELAELDFKSECRRDDIPADAQGILVRMVQQRWTRLESEGLSAESYSGASESYMSDLPDDLRRAMQRYRRVVVV